MGPASGRHRTHSLSGAAGVDALSRRRGFLLEFSYPDPTPADTRSSGTSSPSWATPECTSARSTGESSISRWCGFTTSHPKTSTGCTSLNSSNASAQTRSAPLAETMQWGWPAQAYGFGWTEDGRPVERSVLLRPIDGETYRIIFDPRSDLNARLIETLVAPSERGKQSHAPVSVRVCGDDARPSTGVAALAARSRSGCVRGLWSVPGLAFGDPRCRCRTGRLGGLLDRSQTDRPLARAIGSCYRTTRTSGAVLRQCSGMTPEAA